MRAETGDDRFVGILGPRRTGALGLALADRCGPRRWSGGRGRLALADRCGGSRRWRRLGRLALARGFVARPGLVARRPLAALRRLGLAAVAGPAGATATAAFAFLERCQAGLSWGAIHCAVRWKTTSRATRSTSADTICTAVEPVPMMPMRRPSIATA